MKKVVICFFLLISGIIKGQDIRDTLVPIRSVQVFAWDTILERSFSDSVRYSLHTRNDNNKGRYLHILYDSVFAGFSFSSEHSSIFFSDKGAKETLINLVFYDNTTVPKEYYHQEGAIIREIHWNTEGIMIDFFECNYAECDQCMREIFDTTVTRSLKRRVFYMPFGCYDNLEVHRLRGDILFRKAVPIKSIDFQDGKVVQEKEYEIDKFYIN